MTEKEILAELKTAYLNLEDVMENNERQITEDENSFVMIAMHNIRFVYQKLWKRIEKENKEILFYEKDVMIADTPYNDYVTRSKDYDDQYLRYDDTENKTKWWEDYEFLTK